MHTVYRAALGAYFLKAWQPVCAKCLSGQCRRWMQAGGQGQAYRPGVRYQHTHPLHTWILACTSNARTPPLVPPTIPTVFAHSIAALLPTCCACHTPSVAVHWANRTQFRYPLAVCTPHVNATKAAHAHEAAWPPPQPRECSRNGILQGEQHYGSGLTLPPFSGSHSFDATRLLLINLPSWQITELHSAGQAAAHACLGRCTPYVTSKDRKHGNAPLCMPTERHYPGQAAGHWRVRHCVQGRDQGGGRNPYPHHHQEGAGSCGKLREAVQAGACGKAGRAGGGAVGR